MVGTCCWAAAARPAALGIQMPCRRLSGGGNGRKAASAPGKGGDSGRRAGGVARSASNRTRAGRSTRLMAISSSLKNDSRLDPSSVWDVWGIRRNRSLMAFSIADLTKHLGLTPEFFHHTHTEIQSQPEKTGCSGQVRSSANWRHEPIFPCFFLPEPSSSYFRTWDMTRTKKTGTTVPIF